jgi:small subunit ribosomal protein S19
MLKRSKWKGPFSNLELFKEIKKSKNIRTKLRNNIILPKYVNLTFYIYNGKQYVPLLLTEQMVGKKFGEFILTRQPFKFKKKK